MHRVGFTAAVRIALAIVCLTARQGAALGSESSRCSRACLNMAVDAYLAAVVAHDPSRVMWARDRRFVENTVPMNPGDGLWKTASALPTTFRIYVPDPTAQQVGFIGVLQEEGKPVELALRLKIHDGRIVEAEHLIQRDLAPSALANLQTPRQGLLTVVPPTQRSPREKLLKIGLSYYDALVNSDGSLAPFADDCARREGGVQTTSNPPPATPGGVATLRALGCAANLSAGAQSIIKRIEPRRVWIADVETGLVFGLSQFRHPMKETTVRIIGVPGVDHRDIVDANGKPMKPFDMTAAHIFKVRDGRIHEIEALGIVQPYDSKTGWEAATASASQDTTPGK